MNEPGMEQAAFMRQVIDAIIERGVTFDGTPNGLNLAYNSETKTITGFRLIERATDHIKVDDPRLVEKLTAQCLHLLEYEA